METVAGLAIMMWCFSFSHIHVPIQIQLPFSSLRPVFRARTASDAAPFDASQIISIQACNFIISYFSIGIIVFSFLFFFLWLTVNQNMQLMFSKFEYDGKLNPTFKEGSFQLPVSSIKAYIKDPISPRSILYYLRLEILLLVVLWTVHFYFCRT